MSTERKRFLSFSVLAIASLGFIFVIYIFGASLNPSARSSEIGKYQFWIKDIEISGFKEAELFGKPILIERISENQFQVLEMVSRFKEGTAVEGCIIKKVTPFKRQPSSPLTMFREACRGVDYDSEGNVNPSSEAGALPIVKLNWYVNGNYIYVDTKT